MNDTITYEIECEVCDIESEVVVDIDDEIPAFCPMCGSPVEVK